MYRKLKEQSAIICYSRAQYENELTSFNDVTYKYLSRTIEYNNKNNFFIN